MADVARNMSELSLGRTPTEGPEEAIPHTEEPFANRGPGTFVERFAVGGTVIAGSVAR